MAKLLTTQVTGKVSATLPASEPQDYVRQQELIQALGGVAPLGHTHMAQDIADLQSTMGLLLAGVLVDTDSVSFAFDGAKGGLNARLQEQGGLLCGPQGLYLDPSAISQPGHTHGASDILGLAATLGAQLSAVLRDSNSIRWSDFAPDVRLKANGAMLCDAGGLSLDLGSGPGQAAAGSHTHDLLHNPLTLGDSSTLALGLNGQQLSAEVQLAALGGLLVNSGLAVDFGGGHSQVARGDHTHSELGGTLSVASTQSLSLTLGASLTGAVRCDPSPSAGLGRLAVGSAGLAVALGVSGDTAAPGNHGHGPASPSVNGFMSAADKAKLDSLANEALVFDSPLVRSGLEVWLPAASSIQGGYMSNGDKVKLDALDATPLTYGAPLQLSGHTVSLLAASPAQAGYMAPADKAKLDSLDATPLTFQPPLLQTGHAVSMSMASATNSGFLTTADWVAFNSKAPASHSHPAVTLSTNGFMTPGDKNKLDMLQLLAFNAAAPIQMSGGSYPTPLTFSIPAASAGTDGYLSKEMYSFFLSKEPQLTVDEPIFRNYLGHLSMRNVSTTTDGYLCSSDFNNFQAKQEPISVSAPLVLTSGKSLSLAQASAAQAGYMSAEDKVKLDGLTAGQNVFSGGTVSGTLAFGAGLDPAIQLDGGFGLRTVDNGDGLDLEITGGGSPVLVIEGNGYSLRHNYGNLKLAGAIQINGVQVLSDRQAAITNAAALSGSSTANGYGFSSAAQFNGFVSNANAAITQLNAVLSAMRAHGLIG